MKSLLALVLLASFAQAQDPPPGIILEIFPTPISSAPKLAGTEHTITATVLINFAAASGVALDWTIVSGPNVGGSGTCSPSAACITNASGQVSFTYTGTGGGGQDVVEICETNFGSGVCATALVNWECGVPYCFDEVCACDLVAPATGTDGPVAAGCPNETGVGAILSASGTTSVDADDLVLTCTNIPLDKFGIIFMGTSPACIPGFWGGQLAVTGTMVRLGSQNSGATGTFTQSNLANDPLIQPPGLITPGSTWFFQAWYRSNQICNGTFLDTLLTVDANLSNGYCVSFTP